MCFTGKNRVTLTAFDERRYAFGVQLARKRSQTEVRSHAARRAADPGERQPRSGGETGGRRMVLGSVPFKLRFDECYFYWQVRSMMAPPLELPAAVAAVCRAVTGDTLSTSDEHRLRDA